MKCDKACQSFRFNPKAGKLFASYSRIWKYVKAISAIAIVASILLILLVALIIMQGVKTSQNFFLITYIIALVAIFIILVLFWRVYNMSSHDHSKKLKPFSHAVSNGCFIDPTWKNVAHKWSKGNSVTKIHNWVWWLMWFFLALFIVAVGVGIWALNKLAKGKSR